MRRGNFVWAYCDERAALSNGNFQQHRERLVPSRLPEEALPIPAPVPSTFAVPDVAPASRPPARAVHFQTPFIPPFPFPFPRPLPPVVAKTVTQSAQAPDVEGGN
jgi:hypothetical protein